MILHFCDFRKATFLPIRYIFRSSIPKNRRISTRARASHEGQSLDFQKITGTLNLFFFFLKICRNLHYASNYNRQKEKSKVKFFKYFFIFQKWAERFFDLNNSKTICFGSIYSFLAFKNNQRIQ